MFTRNVPVDLLDRSNYRDTMAWYQKGYFTAFYDRALRLWTVTERDNSIGNTNQVGDAEYFNNKDEYRVWARKWNYNN